MTNRFCRKTCDRREQTWSLTTHSPHMLYFEDSDVGTDLEAVIAVAAAADVGLICEPEECGCQAKRDEKASEKMRI